ncbi:hypothetical protein J6590_026048 [Homalodisca vitripennis]|nr:hypothetical protein J6590_026048 [Homalodisca vitripennis]
MSQNLICLHLILCNCINKVIFIYIGMVLVKIINTVVILKLIQRLLCYENCVLSAYVENNGNSSFILEDEEEVKPYLVNGTILLNELTFVNSHVHKLIHFLSDEQRDEESYGMKVAHVISEMMDLHDHLADLEFDEGNMRHNLSMTHEEIEKAKHLYYDSINCIYNFNKLVGG